MDQSPDFSQGPLAGYRVIDLADDRGETCGWTLGFLGADVIKVEPPGGGSSRMRRPFYGDQPDPTRSLPWLGYNTNKRGITLDIEQEEGRALLRSLATTADILIESFDPGYMDGLGLGYAALEALNPRLVVVSVSHFGQTGPYRDYRGADLVHWALNSAMYASGDPDRPPLRVTMPQTYGIGGTHAAVGALIATIQARRTGHGQHVDQSIQESMLLAAHNHAQHWDMTKTLVRRSGVNSMAPAGFKSIFACADGYICFSFRFGRARAGVQNLVNWMRQEGKADVVNTIDWEHFEAAQVPSLDPELVEKLVAEVEAFFRSHTKAELYDGAVKYDLFLYPASSTKDLYGMEQLRIRDYFQDVFHPDLGRTVRYPGAFVKFSDTPIRIRRVAPAVGEHNAEVYSELGVGSEALAKLASAGVV